MDRVISASLVLIPFTIKEIRKTTDYILDIQRRQ